jgi:apolipoprotein N-acyltransferase
MILRLVAALASGAILCVVSPPIGQHWLEWFSFIGLFWALRPGEHRANAWLSYATGWIAVFLLFGWLFALRGLENRAGARLPKF